MPFEILTWYTGTLFLNRRRKKPTMDVSVVCTANTPVTETVGLAFYSMPKPTVHAEREVDPLLVDVFDDEEEAEERRAPEDGEEERVAQAEGLVVVGFVVVILVLVEAEQAVTRRAGLFVPAARGERCLERGEGVSASREGRGRR